MTINIEEFRKYLKIDKFDLDEELRQQPTLFERVGSACVQAAAERDAIKEALAIADATLDQGFRKSNEKSTEASIKSQILATEEHQTVFNQYLEAKLIADEWVILKEAFIDRAHRLRDLCALYTANYWESDSIRTTQDTDAATYKRHRERLAVGRAERRK